MFERFTAIISKRKSRLILKRKFFNSVILINLAAILTVPFFKLQVKLILLVLNFLIYKIVNTNRQSRRALGRSITLGFLILHSLSPFKGIALATTRSFTSSELGLPNRMCYAVVDCPERLINQVIKRHRNQGKTSFIQKFKKTAPQRIRDGLNVLAEISVGGLAVVHAVRRVQAMPYYNHRLTPEARVLNNLTTYVELSLGCYAMWRPFIDPADDLLIDLPVLYSMLLVCATPDFVFKQDMLADMAVELRDQGIELGKAMFDLKNQKSALTAAYDETRIIKEGSREIKKSLKTCIQEKELLTLKHLNTDNLTTKLQTKLSEKENLIKDLLNEVNWVKTQPLQKNGLGQLIDDVLIDDMNILP